MKNILVLILSSLLLWGCAATVNTVNMPPQERLDYAMKLYHNEDYQEALKEFQAIVLQYPGNAVVDTAQFYLGKTRYQRKEFILGAYEFSKLIKNMPSSTLVPESQYMLAQCYYLLSPYYALDQKYTKKAIDEFQAFIDFFPTNPKVPDAEKKINELNTKLAHKEYNTAYIYTKLEDYNAALMYYDYVIDTYHDTKYGPMAMYSKIELLIDRDRNDEALAEASKFIERYPKDENIKKVEDLKKKLEEKLTASK